MGKTIVQRAYTAHLRSKVREYNGPWGCMCEDSIHGKSYPGCDRFGRWDIHGAWIICDDCVSTIDYGDLPEVANVSFMDDSGAWAGKIWHARDKLRGYGARMTPIDFENHMIAQGYPRPMVSARKARV